MTICIESDYGILSDFIDRGQLAKPPQRKKRQYQQ